MRIFLATALRDEGPFLLEWLAWQRLLGVTDIAVYSNDCRDGSDQMLDLLAAEGVLTHIRNQAPAGKSLQWSALKQAWDSPARKAADWMLFADVDEFPVIHIGNHRFADLLGACPEADAFVLPWRLFGNGGQIWAEDRPVTASFLQAAPPDLHHPIAATMFKTLFRPQAFQKAGVHRPLMRKASPPRWVDGSGRRLVGMVAQSDKRLSLWPLTGDRDLVELHHYSLRALESFIVKSERGLPNRASKPVDLSYWVARNFNNVENRAALVLQEELAREIAALKAIKGIEALHCHALQWHRQQAQRLLRLPEYYQLFAHCRHAGSSAALSQAEARALYDLFQRVARD